MPAVARAARARSRARRRSRSADLPAPDAGRRPAASLAPPRLTTTLLGLFAALALVITAAGIAGVIAFSVSQRTQEFGVRVALGASRADVVSMVVGEGVRLAVTGLTIGLLGAVVLGALLSTVLFGVGPLDAVTYLAVSSVLLARRRPRLPAARAARGVRSTR